MEAYKRMIILINEKYSEDLNSKYGCTPKLDMETVKTIHFGKSLNDNRYLFINGKDKSQLLNDTISGINIIISVIIFLLLITGAIFHLIPGFIPN